MPLSALHVCRPGCFNLVGPGRSCPLHRRSRWAARQARDGSRVERGYGSAWERVRVQVGQEELVCRICGSPDPRWVCDHIIPKCRGGSDTRDNARRLCRKCNAKVTSAQGHAARKMRQIQK